MTELVRHEPTWALAYCWLPLFGHAELPELLATATSRLVKPPESVAEFALWIEAYGTSAGVHYLSRHLSLLQGWDIGLLVRAAEMLKQLPRKEQARPARRFCALLMDLPAHTLYQSFLYHDAFALLVSLLASSGGPRDREKALKVVGGVLRDELREGRSILANWYEAYLTLLDRTFGQGRGGLSIEVTKRLVNVGTFEHIGERYEACRKREHQLSIGPLLDLGLELFARFTTEVAEGAEIGTVPSNVVKLAVTWAEQDDLERLFEQYLACIEVFSSTRVPLDRVAPLVQPSFRVIRRCTHEARRRLLVVLLRWVPEAGMVATEETGKFLLRLLRFIATQPWLDDEVVEGARKVLLNLVLNPEYAYETGRKICAKLTVEMRGSSLDPALSLGFPDEWWCRQGLANEYLIQTAVFAWSPAERVPLATRIRELWAENRNVWLNLSKALLRLGEYHEGSSVAAQMAMTDPKWPDPHGLLAVASARQDNLSVAYKNHLATVVTIWERYHVGLRPWLAVWVHSELAETTRGIDREMHIVCAALARDGRLPAYNQLRTADRNVGLIGDGESAS